MELLEDAALTGTQQLLDDLGHATSPGKFAAGPSLWPGPL
jgi:hypothetical protein